MDPQPTARTLQASVEDYHSDDSDHVLRQNFPRKASPAASAQANVATKRSKELSPDSKAQKPPTDGRSDSGYSSYTAASKSSADSAPSQHHPSPPPTAAPAVVAPHSGSSSPAPPKLRRPTAGADHRQPSNESSPRRKTVSRNPSVSSKPRPERPPPGSRRPTVTRASRDIDQDAECTDPLCDTCGPNARKSRPPPTASALEFASYNSDQASQRSDPNPRYNPPSPTYTRNHYHQGPAIMQPSHSRRRSSSTVRVRPQSYAGESGAAYYVPGMSIPGYPSPPQERGPPPAMSAYANMGYPPMNQHYMGQQPPATQQPYYAPPANQTSPPYDMPRSRHTTRDSGNYSQRSYPAPIITQDRSEPSKYSARYGGQQQPPTPSEYTGRGRPQPRLTQEPHVDDESSSEEEEDDSYDEYELSRARGRTERAVRERALAERRLNERALMPPPEMPAPKRSKSKRRPTLPPMSSAPVIDTAATRERRRKSIVVNDPRQPVVLAERPKIQQAERGERLSRTNTAPARRESVSRPRLERVSQSEYPVGAAQMMVNSSRRPTRRDSYQGQTYQAILRDAIEEQKRQRRASRTYEERPMPGGYFDDDEEEEVVPQPLTRPRRKTDAGKSKDRPVETKTRRTENVASAAEEYINSTRGARTPVADSVNRAAKRASRMPVGHSESGSSNSNGSGKQSISQRTTMTNGANNEIRLRVDTSAPIALSFTGEMENRTLQLIPAENGMTDVVIGNRETAYHSERGSVSGSHRRSIMGPSSARRDAEDMISERSTRSAPRSRREREDPEERHVLRRTTRNYYS